MRQLLNIGCILAVLATTAFGADSEHLAWEKQIVASCLVLEAANQEEEGMRAVASVIHNRANGDSSEILKVVKKPYAFTSLNSATTGKSGSAGFAGHVRRASQDRHWPLALSIVDEMYSGDWEDITDGADHYVRRGLYPSWARKMDLTAIIGEHVFFASIN